jgi:protein-L-isoaspartate(D-aspartate) O-methyltransferase
MKQRPSFPVRLDLAGKRSRIAPGQGAATMSTSRAQAHPGAGTIVKAASPGNSSHPAPQAALESHAVRRSMVQKLARQGLSDPKVMAALATVERHRFVDSALRGQAYEDTSLPIGLGQTISKPGVVARMLELLRNGCPAKLGRVLEVGTGCGYQVAVLSLLADEVYSIERLRGLHDKARENLRHLRLPNVHLLFGDGMAGFAKGAPYAGIIAAAGGDAVPQAWTDQLAVGGRLVAPVSIAGGGSRQQTLLVIDKTVHGLHQSVFEAVHFVPLKSGVA